MDVASTKATKLADTHTGTHALAHTMAIVTGWGYAMGSLTMAEHKLPGRATSTCQEKGRKREGENRKREAGKRDREVGERDSVRGRRQAQK